MESPTNSPKEVQESSPPPLLRQQRRVSTASNPEILLDSSNDSFDHIPLNSSVATSTPIAFKYLTAIKSGEDPFETPPHTESSGNRSMSTPPTASHSNSSASMGNSSASMGNSSASMEIFLGPQPMSFIHHRHRLIDYAASPIRPRTEQSSFPGTSRGVPIKSSGATAMTPEDTDGKDDHPVQLSKWRQEQIKKQKPGRPVNGARERPIPLLHGPLSLPYARNPSGVDATVADQSSYLSNVFGLRVANSPDGKNSQAPRLRLPSDSTTGRTVSGSSTKSNRTTSSFGSTRLVRDYNQSIGIKKDLLALPQESKGYEAEGIKVAALAPEIPPLQLDHRSSLGIGKPRAAAAAWSRTTAEQLASEADCITITLVEPLTNQAYTVKVPKKTYDPNQQGVACEIVPAGTVGRPTAQHSTVAESTDWRAKPKPKSYAHVQPPPLPHPSPVQVPPPPPSAIASPSAHKMRQPPPVLTVEHLYEKFGQKKKVSIDAPSPAHGSPVPFDARPITSPIPESPVTLGDSTDRVYNTAADSAKATSKRRGRSNKSRSANRAKGTPNAGKYLQTPPADTTPVKGPNFKQDTPNPIKNSTLKPAQASGARKSPARGRRGKKAEKSEKTTEATSATA